MNKFNDHEIIYYAGSTGVNLWGEIGQRYSHQDHNLNMSSHNNQDAEGDLVTGGSLSCDIPWTPSCPTGNGNARNGGQRLDNFMIFDSPHLYTFNYKNNTIFTSCNVTDVEDNNRY